jgi:hypothetical protein
VLRCRAKITDVATNPLGNANIADPLVYKKMEFYVIGNEAGWFPQIQVRHFRMVQGFAG